MHSLTGDLLLQAWERGHGETDVMRPVYLLSLALPEMTYQEIASLPLAERNALLLELRAITFGPVMNAFASCPDCSARLEFSLSAQALRAQITAPAPVEAEELKGLIRRMRPANTLDLAASLQADDVASSRRILLTRCIDPPPQLDEDLTTDLAPSQQNLLQRFEALNESAEINCVIDCPGCQGHPRLDFDIARFFWHEVRAAARRLLEEVHQLASAYGWPEDAILSLTQARRQAYLELVMV